MYLDFADWLAASGFDGDALSPAQRGKLQAAWRAESDDAPAEPADEPRVVQGPQGELVPAAAPPPARSDGVFSEKMAALEAENQRVETIRELTFRECQAHVGNTEKIRQLRQLSDAAVADQRTSVKDFQLALMRAGRFTDPLGLAPLGPARVTPAVVEAAVCRAAGLRDAERHYDPRTLEAVDRHYRNGLGLHDVLGLCARANGWTGQSVKGSLGDPAFLRLAFGQGGVPDLYAGGGAVPSTISLPQLLSAVSNRSLRGGFEAIDMAWKQVAATRSVTDFRSSAALAIGGNLQYQKLPPGGEIKHGTLAETAYANRAETYAIMLGIDRQMLINDDLGALTQSGRLMGRGAAQALNHVFWSVYLNNGTFFTAGNNNVITGPESALSADSLAEADALFRAQTGPDGLPLAAEPRILLVPPALLYTAKQLMQSPTVIGSPATTVPNVNIWQGAYQVVSSPYLSNPSYTGNSATAWYLLADPNDIAVAEVVFLNGRDTPQVDTTDLDWNLLGMSMRGYLDFGAALQEFRGGVRAAGV